MGKDTLKYLSLVTQLGLTVVVGVAFGGFVGFRADSRLGTSPVFTMLGILLGAAGGLWAAYQLVVELGRNHHRDTDD